MAGVTSGDKLKVFIQTADGFIAEMNTYAMSVEQCADSVRGLYVSMNLESFGAIEWGDKKEFLDRTENASEWKCGFCGKPNKREQTTCGENEPRGCGSVRPFIYK